MDKAKLVAFTVLLTATAILLVSVGWTGPKERGPVITNVYAQDKGQYGTVWKIYLEAEAAEAEMAKIAVVVDQPGQGQYPTDFTVLKAPYKNRLKGYLQWNTFSSRGPAVKEGDQITVRVSLIDKAGNESKEVVFPFTFVSGAAGQGSLPPPFTEGDVPRLGYIGIELKGVGGGASP